MSGWYPSARMIVGIVIAAVGGLITWVSYSSANEGGTYVITWGIIAVGALIFLSGLVSFISIGGLEGERRLRAKNEAMMRLMGLDEDER